jgi:hypothetical protein
MASYYHHPGNPLPQKSFLVHNEPVKVQYWKKMVTISNEPVNVTIVWKNISIAAK